MAGNGSLNRKDVAEWLVNRQHDRARARYADIENGAAFRRLFSEFAYPRWNTRPDYTFRAEFFKKVVTGQMARALAPFRPFFSRQLEQLSNVDSIMDYLLMVAELYDLSMSLDDRMMDCLLKRCASPGDLNDAAYRDAFRECATRDERRRQTDMVLDLAAYAKRTVDRGGFIDTLVRTFPTIPVFKRNHLVRGVNETIGMGRAAWRAAKRHSEDLPEFIAVIREREYAFIDSMMDGDQVKDVKTVGSRE